MKKRNLFWQFFGAHTLILLLAIVSISIYTWFESNRIFRAQWMNELEVQADLATAMFEGVDNLGRNADDYHKIFKRLERLDRHRFTLIMPDGSILGDTRATAADLDSHDMRPEIVEARAVGKARRERFSATLGQRMVYVARRIPADLARPEQAIMRVSVPVATLSGEISTVNREITVMAAVILLAALLLSYLASLRIVGPVSELQTGLTLIGNGEYAHRLKVPPVPHLAALVRSINQTADQLENHIQQIEEERNLRALVLKSMDIGIIAVDAETRIMNMNKSAVNLLNVRSDSIQGCRIGEVVRQPDLLAFLEEGQASPTKVEKIISVEIGDTGDDERIIALQSTVLDDLQGQRIGTLIVLSDITRLRKLERIRQDFVDNVSHELRTPVTSIKGFSETLLDGALDDPANARHFVEIIDRQAGQLEQIIRDLLELSRLDRNVDKELERCMTPVEVLIENAVELCQNRASDLNIKVNVNCATNLNVTVHQGLMEQALVNLIDNALKYGCNENSRQVDISAVKDGLSVKICVQDYGAGVEKRHLERMFERFYRVDSGRSRELGGTGLGLSIVKHIVLLHHGTVEVNSEPGRGASFTITLSESAASPSL